MQQFRYFFKQSPVTALLFLATLLYFLLMQVLFWGQSTSAYAVYASGGIYGAYLKGLSPQYWRLFSPIFVHIGWQHVIMNLISLYFVGAIAERLWGAWRFLILYLLSGVMGNVFVAFFTPEVVSAGASTSLFGLFSGIALVGYFGKSYQLKAMGRNFQTLLVLNLISSVLMPGISLAGHLGGAVGGVLSAVFLPTRFDKNMFKNVYRIAALILYLLLVILLL